MATVSTFTAGQVVTAAQLTFLLDPPRVTGLANATQSIPNNAFTAVVLQTEPEDSDTMFTPGGSLVTAKTAGRYVISAYGSLAANATGIRILSVFINGVDTYRVQNTVVTAAINWSGGVSAVHRLAVNDTVEMRLFQNSGGALSTVVSASAGEPSRLALQWVGK